MMKIRIYVAKSMERMYALGATPLQKAAVTKVLICLRESLIRCSVAIKINNKSSRIQQPKKITRFLKSVIIRAPSSLLICFI